MPCSSLPYVLLNNVLSEWHSCTSKKASKTILFLEALYEALLPLNLLVNVAPMATATCLKNVLLGCGARE